MASVDSVGRPATMKRSAEGQPEGERDAKVERTGPSTDAVVWNDCMQMLDRVSRPSATKVELANAVVKFDRDIIKLCEANIKHVAIMMTAAAKTVFMQTGCTLDDWTPQPVPLSVRKALNRSWVEKHRDEVAPLVKDIELLSPGAGVAALTALQIAWTRIDWDEAL